MVKRGLLIAAALGLALAAPPPNPAPPRDVLDKYCVTCHNQRLKTAGLTLDTADVSNVAGNAEVWEKVIRKLRAGAMPPPGAARPDQATYSTLISHLERQIDTADAVHPYAGRPVLHRMNRAEYGNAIRDLPGLGNRCRFFAPPDDSAYGFDNISDALEPFAVAPGALFIGRAQDRRAGGGRSEREPGQ